MKHLQKTISAIALLVFFAPIFLSAQQDSLLKTNPKSEIRELGDFSIISVSGNIHVELIKGDKASVKLIEYGKESILSELSTSIEHDELILQNLDLGEEAEIHAIVTYVSLSEIYTVAGGEISKTDLIKSKSLKIKINTGGLAHMNIETEELELDVVNASELFIKGKATKADMRTNNASKLHAYDLLTKEMFITAFMGVAEINVSDKLEAKSTLDSHIYYKGAVTDITQKISSGGQISKK